MSIWQTLGDGVFGYDNVEAQGESDWDIEVDVAPSWTKRVRVSFYGPAGVDFLYLDPDAVRELRLRLGEALDMIDEASRAV